jgi:hypothetical protein
MASHQQRLADVVSVTWVLNLTNLRLSLSKLRREESSRAALCARLKSQLEQAAEPQRWAMMQQALEHHAGSALIGTLQRCVISYQARLGVPMVAFSEIDRELGAAELRIVDAMLRGDEPEAERAQRAAHHQLSQLLGCPDLPYVSGAARTRHVRKRFALEREPVHLTGKWDVRP